MTDTEISILFLFSFVLYHFIIHPAFISSLSQLPNAHWSAPYSNLWIKWQRYRGRANRAIHAAHTRLGPVLRLGASEISVNSAECVKVVYSNDAFEKDEWYARAFANYGYVIVFRISEDQFIYL
jgi:unspecific monooxygenase